MQPGMHLLLCTLLSSSTVLSQRARFFAQHGGGLDELQPQHGLDELQPQHGGGLDELQSRGKK